LADHPLRSFSQSLVGDELPRACADSAQLSWFRWHPPQEKKSASDPLAGRLHICGSRRNDADEGRSGSWFQLDGAAEFLFTEEATASTHQRSGVSWEIAVEKWRTDKLSQGIKPSTFGRFDRKRMEHTSLSVLPISVLRMARRLLAWHRLISRVQNIHCDHPAIFSTSKPSADFWSSALTLGFHEKWLLPSSRRKL